MLFVIADDDCGNRDFYQEIMEVFYPNAEIVMATNGREAADKLMELAVQGRIPDLLLTDFDMPNMNGLRLLVFIDEEIPRLCDMPRIMVSGMQDDALRRKIEDRNCLFLSKPCPMRELRAAIRAKTGL